jgi:hypothetical protein
MHQWAIGDYLDSTDDAQSETCDHLADRNQGQPPTPRPASRMWTSPHRLACAQDGVYCVVLRRSETNRGRNAIVLANTRPKVSTLPKPWADFSRRCPGQPGQDNRRAAANIHRPGLGERHRRVAVHAMVEESMIPVDAARRPQVIARRRTHSRLGVVGGFPRASSRFLRHGHARSR